MNLQRSTLLSVAFVFCCCIELLDAKNITFCLYCENAECSGTRPRCMEYEIGKCSEFLNLCNDNDPHANMSISFTENEDQTYTYRTYSEEYPACYKSRMLWNETTECGKCDGVTNAMIQCSDTTSASPFDIAYILAATIIGVLALFVVLLIVLFFYVKRRKTVRYTRQYFSSEEQTGLLRDFNKQQQISSQASQDNNLYMGKYLYSAKFLQEYGVPWAMIEVDHSSTEFEEVSNWFNEDLHRKSPVYFLERQQQDLPPVGFEVTRAFKIINEKKQQEIEHMQEKIKKDGVPLEELKLVRAYHGASTNNIELLCRQSLSRSKASTQSRPQDEGWKFNPPDGVFVVRYPEFTLQESNNGRSLNAGDRVKVVMFYVLLGKTFHVTKMASSLPKGVHSLLSPSSIEWCLLDDAQCLPAYVVEIEAK